MNKQGNDILNTPQYVENTEETLQTQELTDNDTALNYLEDPEAYLEWFNSTDGETTGFEEGELTEVPIISSTGEIATGETTNSKSYVWIACIVIGVLIICAVVGGIKHHFVKKNREVTYDE